MTSKTRRIIGKSPMTKRELQEFRKPTKYQKTYMPLEKAEAIVRRHRRKYGKYSITTDIGKWHHREEIITRPTKNPREYTKVRRTTKIWDLLFP